MMLALTSFGQSVLARKNTVNILELFYRENGMYCKRTSKTGLGYRRGYQLPVHTLTLYVSDGANMMVLAQASLG